MATQYHKKIHEHMCSNVHVGVDFVCACLFLRMRNFTHRSQVFVHISLVFHWHLMGLSLKFHKNLTISWGYIPLFVTLYYFENEKNLYFSSKIIAKSTPKFPTFWDTFLNMFELRWAAQEVTLSLSLFVCPCVPFFPLMFLKSVVDIECQKVSARYFRDVLKLSGSV